MSIKDAFKHEKSTSPAQIVHMLNVMEKLFGFYNPVIGFELHSLYKKKQYAKCVSVIKRQMGVTKTVGLKVYENHLFKEECGDAAGIVNVATLDNRKEFNVIKIPRSTIEKYHKFIQVIVHELSHVILYDVKHEFKYSEIATDLLGFLFGFGVIFETQRYADKTVKVGYLSSGDIEVALAHLHIRYTRKQKLLYFVSHGLNKTLGLLA